MMNIDGMEKMNNIKALLGTLGLMLVAGSASAVQYTTWNFATSTNIGNLVSCGSNCKSLTIGGETMTVRAYRTPSATSALGAATVTAEVNYGLGVTGSGDGSPAIDNSGTYDVMVLDGGSANFDWEELTLGFKGSDADFQAWSGNNFDFTSMCLASGGTCGTSNSIYGASFSATNNGYNYLGTYSNPPLYPTAVNLDASKEAKGRYLVIAGDLGASSSFNDAFKIKTIKGAPEPATFLLLGIGVLAMLTLSRRQAVFSRT